MKLSYEEADKLAPSSIPMGRIAEVESEECANLVVMLASPLMHMVNGTMIEIDGGQEKALMDRAGSLSGSPSGLRCRRKAIVSKGGDRRPWFGDGASRLLTMRPNERGASLTTPRTTPTI